MIVGSGAREHAIARAFAQSAAKPVLACCGTTYNPGIQQLTSEYWIGDICCVEQVIQKALEWQIKLVIIGPEAPLAAGLVDALQQQGIATVGPKKIVAQLETSKIFTRMLLKKYQIPGSLKFHAFSSLIGVMEFLHVLGADQYVIKADGLMSGKGVKVAGEHLHSFTEAYEFCASLLNAGGSFIIEEKLIGQEFSLLSFCDGKHLIPMPLVQDHKRAFVDDLGPNTGGMGSYSDANHSLPFLTTDDIVAAQEINTAVIAALARECGVYYQGILYGSFMVTGDGVRLIEYNARFGDPEALNVLAILDCDFTELCQALVAGNLQHAQVRFKPLATVCKYAVPFGYPDKPEKHSLIDVSAVTNHEQLYFAAVNDIDGELYTTGSRAVAVVGIAPTIAAAEMIAENEINCIRGRLFHREDIGQTQLIKRRIKMMQSLRAAVNELST